MSYKNPYRRMIARVCFIAALISTMNVVGKPQSTITLYDSTTQLPGITPTPPQVTTVTIPNKKVNQDNSLQNQDETAIAINPSNPTYILVGANDFLFGNQSSPGYYFSDDAGENWTGSVLEKGLYRSGGDPSVAYDRHGIMYYAHLLFNGPPITQKFTDNGVFVNKTTSPNNLVWLPTPMAVLEHGDGSNSTEGIHDNFEDQPNIICDNLAGSPFLDRLYIAWSHLYGYGIAGDVYFRVLLPGGTTFESIAQVNDDLITYSSPGAHVALNRSGTVYVVWDAKISGTHVFMIDSSSDGGINFTNDDQVAISSVIKIPGDLKGFLRSVTYPSFAIDVSGGRFDGAMYLVWADARSGGPEILFSRRLPGGAWEDPKAVQSAVPGRDQWNPAIALSPNGTLSIKYYDSRNDPNNILTDVYVSTSVDGGETFFHTEVNQTSFDPRVNTAMLFADYDGIAATDSRVYPVWTDTRSGTDQDVYIALLDYQPVTLDQLASNGTTHPGTLGRWSGSSFAPRFAAPQPFSFLPGSMEVFDPDVNVILGEKYHDWNNEVSNIISHQSFSIGPTTNFIVSHMQPITTNIVIRNELIDSPTLDGGTIGFRDPWLVDYLDATYGYGNRGQAGAEWHDNLGSSFHPDLSHVYNGFKYNGVFLNENPINDPNKPIYAARALQLQTIQSYQNCSFLGWAATKTSQITSPTTPESPVIFKDANDTIKARYKAHLATNTSNILASNSQRKIATSNFLGSTTHQIVYESAGTIWATQSTDNGAHWSSESNISGSPPAGTTYRNPTVDIVLDGTDLSVYAWEAVTLSGAQWDHTIKTTISQFQTVATFSTSVDQPAYPVMTILKEPYVELDAIVAWKGANGLRWADKMSGAIIFLHPRATIFPTPPRWFGYLATV